MFIVNMYICFGFVYDYVKTHIECAFDHIFELFTGQPHMTARSLAQWVNLTLELEGDDKYCTSTMEAWLHNCVFKVIYMY
jgi:hypothetical protein